MLIKSIEFVELELPFKGEFNHARKTRTSTLSILVCVQTSTGIKGWGEIVPRSYVTGETADDIFNENSQRDSGRALCQQLVGRTFDNQKALIDWIDEALPLYSRQTALFGGVELALWNALCQTMRVEFDSVVGPVNKRVTGRCHTIGFETDTDSLRKQAIAARMSGATVVKLKIGVSDDIERVLRLNSCLNGKTPIRVDANGLYKPEQVEALLKACAGATALQSIEEPFDRMAEGMIKLQPSFYKHFGVAFVADESICSVEQAVQLVNNGYFQIFNLRIGKHGGLRATCKLRDLADKHHVGLVCGSMVGETGILTKASELLLLRSTQFDYVEGLGQNNRFLAIDPVETAADAGQMGSFSFKEAQCQELIRRRLEFN